MNNENNSIIVDANNNQITLIDDTSNHILAVKVHFFDRLKIISKHDNIYILECKSLAHYDAIITQLTRYKFPFVETDNLRLFLDNLQANSLTNRINKCMQIKQANLQLFHDQVFLNFKNIVDNETVRHLKDQQLINAYHHVILRSSLDFSVPGTGKTYIAYGMFIYLHKLKKINKLIVIGPINCFKA